VQTCFDCSFKTTIGLSFFLFFSWAGLQPRSIPYHLRQYSTLPKKNHRDHHVGTEIMVGKAEIGWLFELVMSELFAGCSNWRFGVCTMLEQVDYFGEC
jgi:hypothetical protein